MMRMKITVKVIIVTLVASAFLFTTGLMKFYDQIPESLTPPIEKVDAIIILTGGKERIAEGIKLLNRGFAPRILISGVGKDTKITELLKEQNLPDDEKTHVDYSKLDVGREAINTIGNAREAADWARANRITSIYLVTANYHMPRALVEFEKQMPDIKILPYPVFPKEFNKQDWRDDEKTRNYILKEYMKYLIARLGK